MARHVFGEAIGTGDFNYWERLSVKSRNLYKSIDGFDLLGGPSYTCGGPNDYWGKNGAGGYVVLPSTRLDDSLPSSGTTPAFVFFDDCGTTTSDKDNFKALLQSIPDVYDNANDPTELRSLIFSVFKIGGWFYMKGGRAPIAKHLLLSYQFGDKECWSGGASVLDLSGNGHHGVMNNSSNGSLDVINNGVTGSTVVWTTGTSNYVTVSNNLGTGISGLGYVWVGYRKDASGEETVFDSTGGGGERLSTERSGYDFNWGNETNSRFNNSNGYQAMHQGIATVGNNSCAMAYNGHISSSGGVSSNFDNIGSALRIGTDAGLTKQWDGGFNSFLIYTGSTDAVLDEDEIAICWLNDAHKVLNSWDDDLDP